MTKRENPKRRENVEKKKNRRETSRTEYVSKGNRVNTQGYRSWAQSQRSGLPSGSRKKCCN